MTFEEALPRLINGEDLDQADARSLFGQVLGGDLTPAQIAALVTALASKGEAVTEVAGAAEAMRAVSTKVDVVADYLVDTCGTGGSGGAKRFNISTAAAFATAAAGAHVAKHGNRGMTSKSGSADVLEAAGVRIDLASEETARCISEVGVGFMFAQTHHSAMRFAAPVRRELGFRTIFNVLGPLTNPAGAKRQVLGVFAPEWQRPLAEVAGLLGAEHVMVVHSDGLDELSIANTSRVAELKDGKVEQYEIDPGDFGIARQSMDDLRAESAEESLALVRTALNGSHPAASDIVAMNAGAAIYVAGIATSLENGVLMAQDAIAAGLATERLTELVNITQLMGRA